MEDVEATIREIICDATGYEWGNLKTSDSLMLDLGLDSLDFAKMEVEAEERLEIEVDSKAFAGVNTVGDLVAKLRELASVG